MPLKHLTLLLRAFLPSFFVTLLIFLTVSPSVFAMSCRKAHVPSRSSKSTEQELSLGQEVRSQYDFTSDSRSAIHLPSGEEATLVDRRYVRMIGDMSIEHSMEITEVFKLVSNKIAAGSAKSYVNFEKIVRESIEFVLSNYAQRRAWTTEFRDHLYEQAYRYASRSTYIQFYADRVLKGTLKVISSSEAKGELLPVEENLKIKIPGNAGEKFELANFAIDKEFNAQAFTDILFQLMLHAKEQSQRPGHDPNQMIYFTYADAFSLRMYKSLGFKPVPGFEEPIEKDGTKWVTVGISSTDVLNIPQFMQQTRPYWDPAVLDRMMLYFPKLQKFSEDNLHIAGYQVGQYHVSVSRPLRLIAEGLFREHKSFIIRIANFKGFYMQFPIPTEFMPLKENSQISLQRDRFHISYKDGKLRVKENSGTRFRQVILEIDPNLKFPQGIDVNLSRK